MREKERRRRRKENNSISRIKQVELKEEKEFVFRGSSWRVPGEERKRKGLRPISPLPPCFKYPEHTFTPWFQYSSRSNRHSPLFLIFLSCTTRGYFTFGESARFQCLLFLETKVAKRFICTNTI